LSAAAVLLALASAATWGIADFSGGLVSRHVPTIPVTLLSQAAGFAALLAAFAVAGGGLDRGSFGLGLLAGLGGGLGLAAFYKAMSLGMMSIVSPITACGAVVPFTISLATGERPGRVALLGAALALAGAVAASSEERRSEAPDRVRAIALAVVAAVAFGLFTYFLGLGSREGSALPTLVGARVGSLALLAVLAAGRRSSLRVGRRWVLPIAAVGLLDVAANVLYALASRHGLLALVSVLASLYPVVTLFLAVAILGERLTRLQSLGVGVALVGVVALSAA
jgi:drug/metabolite transporter (DMT)-like permease